MGTIVITTNGSFKSDYATFSAMDNGHADAVARAIEYLAKKTLPAATAQDHDLHEMGTKPKHGFTRPAPFSKNQPTTEKKT